MCSHRKLNCLMVSIKFSLIWWDPTNGTSWWTSKRCSYTLKLASYTYFSVPLRSQIVERWNVIDIVTSARKFWVLRCRNIWLVEQSRTCRICGRNSRGVKRRTCEFECQVNLQVLVRFGGKSWKKKSLDPIALSGGLSYSIMDDEYNLIVTVPLLVLEHSWRVP